MSRSTDEFSILHVDDDPQILQLSERFLGEADSRLLVETLADPTEAVEAIRTGEYDAVISDYQMPGMDGLELLEAIRQQYSTELPFIMFTGEGEETVAGEALNLGANRYLRKDGDPKTQFTVLVDAVIQEIEHARTETRLQEYATAVEGSDDSIYMLDPDGVYVFANAEHLSRLAADGKISAADEREIDGQPYQSIHPEADADRIAEIIEEVTERREAITEEYAFATEDSWSYRTYSPVVDPETEEIRGVVVISKDITERKRMANREALLHSLLRHDVKNKLHAAHGYLELADTHDLPAEADEWLSTASRLLDDGIELIDNVGTLTELTDHDPEPWALQAAISRVLDSYQPQAETEGVELTADGCTGRVLGGPLLEPLFGNLVSNALTHANADTIEIRCQRDGEFYKITVADDGDGLDDETAATVLEKGISKGESAGTGLGLYLVTEIAESYGGSVSLGDSPAGGLCVTVWLEAAD